jgi:hypothetical protein
MPEDQEAWAAEARTALVDIARQYRAVTTYQALGKSIQESTGVFTKQLVQNWIGEPLAMVADRCASRGEPLLSALCVYKADGAVGLGYAEAVERAYGETPDDLQMHAAEERLKSYRYFHAIDLPGDGGSASLTPQIAAARQRAVDKNSTQRRDFDLTKICKGCFQVPSFTGLCDCTA